MQDNRFGSDCLPEMTSGPIACVITPEMLESSTSMPIGYAAEGTSTYVVDNEGNPVEASQQSGLVVVCANVILEQDQKPGLLAIIRIKKELKQVLPAYRIPQRVEFVGIFPKNSNGKTDRTRLIEENKIHDEGRE